MHLLLDDLAIGLCVFISCVQFVLHLEQSVYGLLCGLQEIFRFLLLLVLFELELHVDVLTVHLDQHLVELSLELDHLLVHWLEPGLESRSLAVGLLHNLDSFILYDVDVEDICFLQSLLEVCIVI